MFSSLQLCNPHQTLKAKVMHICMHGCDKGGSHSIGFDNRVTVCE